MNRDIIHPVGYNDRKKYFYICEDCGEAIAQRLDTIKNMKWVLCRNCANKKRARDNRDKIREATLKQMEEGNWALNNLTQEQEEKRARRFSKTTKNKYSSGELIVWNKGIHVQTNTGRTHFKKGLIPWNYKGICYIYSMIRDKLYRFWRYPILERDNFKCVKCGSIENLNVHHNKERFSEIVSKFIGDIEELSIDDKREIADKILQYHLDGVEGITLCNECHKKEHSDD